MKLFRVRTTCFRLVAAETAAEAEGCTLNYETDTDAGTACTKRFAKAYELTRLGQLEADERETAPWGSAIIKDGETVKRTCKEILEAARGEDETNG